MGALEAIKAAVVLAVGLALGWLASGLYADIVTIPAVREAGVQSERLVWQERQRRAEAKADADRAATQAEIDAIETEFFERDKARVLQVDALEKALEEEQAHAPVPSAADRSACRPAIPRGVRDALDAAGRQPATGPDPAKPRPALR